jgi:hypothetical protein
VPVEVMQSLLDVEPSLHRCGPTPRRYKENLSLVNI